MKFFKRVDFFLFSLILSPAVYGVSISNVTTDPNGIRKTSIRVTYDSDIAGKWQIQYGPTTNYGFTSTGGQYTAAGHSGYITGILPNTLVHFCPQVLDSNGSPSPACDGSHDYTARTGPDDNNGQPTPPEPPRSTVDTTIPSQNGHLWSIPANDCNNASTGLQASIDAAALGDTIEIPAGTACAGRYQFPNKTTGTGWIVIRTATPDAQLPPPGTRIKPSNKPLMASLVDDGISGRTLENFNGPATGGCTPGHFHYNAQPDPNLDLATCPASGQWTLVPFTSGTTVPGSCNPGEWFYKTDADRAFAAYWCTPNTFTGNNEFTRMYMSRGDGSQTSAIEMLSGAHHYRFVGLEITHVKAPSNFVPAGTDEGIVYVPLVSQLVNTHDVVYDRCYVHGWGYPDAVWEAFAFDGQNVAVVDSYIDNITYWRGDFLQDLTPMAFHFTAGGPGPLKIQNNFISSIGISLYVQEDDQFGVANNLTPADAQVLGNYFFKDQSFMTTTEHYYFNRHHLELKRGRRWQIEGNVFENNWAVTQIGPAILIRGAQGYYQYGNQNGTSDILIRNNIIKNAATGIAIEGHPPTSGSDPQGKPTAVGITTERVQINNNVLEVNGYEASALGAYATSKTGGVGFLTDFGFEDFVLNHNTVYRMDGTQPVTFYDESHVSGGGLIIRDNIFSFGISQGPFVIQGTSPNPFGIIALNQYSTRVGLPAASSPQGLDGIWWICDHNVMVGNANLSLYPQPPNNNWIADDSSLFFEAPQNDNFHMTGGPYKGTASDGGDPGVDMDALNKATAGAVDGNFNTGNAAPFRSKGFPSGAVAAGATQTTISLVTDQAATCRYSTIPGQAFDTMTQTFSQTGGASHSSPVTGLQDGQSYKYYVRCQGTNGQTNPDDYVISFGVGLTGGPTTAPTINPNGGTFTTPPHVTLSDTAPGAVIYYTVDGSQPTATSAVYSAPITVQNSLKLNAVAQAPNLTLSSVASATFVINTVGKAILGSSPSSMVFTARQGSGNPPAQTLLMTNTGNASMSWTANNRTSWLSLSSKSGTLQAGNNVTLSASANAATLSTGTYQDVITLAAPGATNSPQTILVNLILVGADDTVLLPGSSQMNFTADPGSGALPSQVLTLGAQGPSNVAWNAVTTASWLTISKKQGLLSSNQNDSLNVLVNASGMSVGIYTEAIIVLAPAAFNNPVIVWVNLIVGNPGASGAFSVNPDLVKIRTYPNPWRNDRDHGTPITWEGLAASTELKVFTLSGHLITTIHADADGTAAWNPKNVASGIYLFLTHNKSGKADHGKFAIIK